MNQEKDKTKHLWKYNLWLKFKKYILLVKQTTVYCVTEVVQTSCEML